MAKSTSPSPWVGWLPSRSDSPPVHESSRAALTWSVPPWWEPP